MQDRSYKWYNLYDIVQGNRYMYKRKSSYNNYQELKDQGHY